MKKFVILTLLLVTTFSTTTFGASEISVYFNNAPVKLSQEPTIINGTTLVPFRSIFEELGFYVEWNGDTKTINGTNGDITISLQIGSTTAYVNGQPQTLVVAPTIIDGTTMVPIRFVSESAGYDVIWNSETQSIQIENKNSNATSNNDDVIVASTPDEAIIFATLPDGTVYTYDDLSTVDGTGKYSGYKKIVGDFFINEGDVYYRGDISDLDVVVDFTQFYDDEIVSWTYKDDTYSDSEGNVFDAFKKIHFAESITYSPELSEILGDTYEKWIFTTQIASDIKPTVIAYIEYSGDYSEPYDMNQEINPDNFNQTTEIVFEIIEDALAGDYEYANFNEQTGSNNNSSYTTIDENTTAEVVTEEWTSAGKLLSTYKVAPTRVEEGFAFQNFNGEIIYELYGSENEFTDGEEHYNNNIHFKYSDAKGQILFLTQDLIKNGIITE